MIVKGLDVKGIGRGGPRVKVGGGRQPPPPPILGGGVSIIFGSLSFAKCCTSSDVRQATSAGDHDVFQQEVTSSITNYMRYASPSPVLPRPEELHTEHHRVASDWCSKFGIPDNATECSAADFVKCDPAHRPPNPFFVKQLVEHPGLLRSVIQVYVSMGPHQPYLPHYPGHEVGGCLRSFSASWFEKYR